MIGYWILFGFLCITGLFMMLSPDAFYRETQAWKQSRPSEPSRAYLIITRIIGGILLLCALGSAALIIAAEYMA